MFKQNTKKSFTLTPNFGVTLRSKEGFTLIELMVVVAISGIVATMVFTNMRSGGRSGDINASAEKLAGVIKQAQMMALSGKRIDEERPAGGYGVYLDTSTDPDSYILFADIFGVDNHKYDSGSDTIIQTIELGEQISISTVAGYSIIFVPPRNSIYVSIGTGINGEPFDVSDDPVVISLVHLDVNFYAWVGINSQGEIDVRKTE